jgi:uncharacterized sodium:solute symporter family permease YidK
MPASSSPFFRKAITPWYHSRLAYMIVIVAMLGIFFFAIAGLGVAREVAAYRSYSWVPILLMILSGALVVTTTIRLIQSYTTR